MIKMNVKMSKHCREDRLDRLVYIATTIGWGEIVIEERLADRRECLTDTGVVMVMGLNDDFLITAFIATLDKAVALCHGARGENAVLPTSLAKRIKKNKKYHDAQNGG